MSKKGLNEIIKINSNFKTAINLYLSLNKTEKILNYIPTKSSLNMLNSYLDSILENKEQASLLVGPYGKGKSHLLLVLMGILSLNRNKENSKVIEELKRKILDVDDIGEEVEKKITKVWTKKGKYLPVIISNTSNDLNQAFLSAINDSLKREGLENIAPESFYSIAVNRINEWKEDYLETYKSFCKELKKRDENIDDFVAELKNFSSDAIAIFTEIYPLITAGSKFNPLAASDVLPLYKGICDVLIEDYDYSGIYIIFDEFSKFIEGQEGIAVGNNMKLLQDICELAIESSKAEVCITMVAHKSIKEYGKYLSPEIINSFTGIEGRIVEKLFVTSSKNNYELIKNAIIKDIDIVSKNPNCKKYLDNSELDKYYRLPIFGSNFKYDDFNKLILQGCYPLNPIATYLLLNISEKVAQNERTLFTFISNDEPHSMARFIKEHEPEDEWIVGADLIYDYFSGLFKKDVNNEFIHNIWLAAEYALTKCDNLDEKKIVKSLATILIINRGQVIPANQQYLSVSVDVDDPESVIKNLVEKEIIYYKKSREAFVFKTKAGSALKKEIKKQRELRKNNVNYSLALKELTGKYYVIPKAYNTDNYITRYFEHEYMDVDVFLEINDVNSLLDNIENADGKVISLFSFRNTKQEAVKKHIKALYDERLVVVLPKNKLTVEKYIKDYSILQNIKNNVNFTEDNEVLKREIPLLEEDLVSVIEDELNSIYFNKDNCRVYYCLENKIKSSQAGTEEKIVSKCCKNLFTCTPIVNNELINRSVINTTQTKKSRLAIIKAILEHKDVELFNIGTNQEATLYRSIFRYKCNNEQANDNLTKVYEVINKFIDSCCENKKELVSLINELKSSPFGVRGGVIPLYVAEVFSQRREDLVVYFTDLEVELTPEAIVNMCEKSDEFSLFVSKEDLQKEKYISSLNELFSVQENRNLTENRIKDIVICMQRWFRNLPEVSRNLVLVEEFCEKETQKQLMSLRKELQKTEVNPYEILFVNLPKAFDTTSLEETYTIIDSSKLIFTDHYDWIINKVIDVTYSVFEPRKKKELYHALSEWYDSQSEYSKQGLHSNKVTNFMSFVKKMDSYMNDSTIITKLIKLVTDIYVEYWTNNSYAEYVSGLKELKQEIESIKESTDSKSLRLSFVGKDGNERQIRYNLVDENTGSILRNILEDTLEEFDDLSVNDRVAILLESIEKIIG